MVLALKGDRERAIEYYERYLSVMADRDWTIRERDDLNPLMALPDASTLQRAVGQRIIRCRHCCTYPMWGYGMAMANRSGPHDQRRNLGSRFDRAPGRDNQLPATEKFCENHGYAITRRYQLSDVSAFKGAHRETLNAMLDDTYRGEFEVVVV